MEYCIYTWRHHYFLQILQKLHHFHHPNGDGKSGSGSRISAAPSTRKEAPVQILGRDLKPKNHSSSSIPKPSFLDIYIVLQYFASTYVGVRHCQGPIPAYTHPFLQDSILEPPSDQANIQAFLFGTFAFAFLALVLVVYLSDSNGRIPPPPQGYSQALMSVIQSMLNLNASFTPLLTDYRYRLRLSPAISPSTAQLLQHD